MRISDWSSDVCSSDLLSGVLVGGQAKSVACSDDAILRQPSVTASREENVAAVPTFHVFPDLINHTTKFDAGCKGTRRLKLVSVLDDQHVRIVDFACEDPDTQFTSRHSEERRGGTEGG